MRLNDVYAQARGNILMLNPLPSMDHAYSLLLQDENQREFYVNAQNFSDSSAFMVTNQGKQHPRSGNPNSRFPHINQHQQNFKFFCNPKPASFPLKSGQITPKFKGRKIKFNPNVICGYCGKLGHIMDDCHRLHGYSDDFEFTKNRNSTYHAKGNATFSNHTGQEQSTPYFNEGLNPLFHASGEGSSTQCPSFTVGQQTEITRMFRELQSSASGPSASSFCYHASTQR
ncbi:hypothetical protein KY290_022257 [Solanum tuberosum]|uniref:CCHC-type domain-containing protein n=1 Tax=Solanum tuberosum TaxID=4113 RepID=A0ABQ7V3T8_SOLTU|nr:hypothetical protein KY289_021389 [Solanum tuberosum]KAH0758764.1 hypothetical protein KY290_022257 [Solanum tuberosum]